MPTGRKPHETLDLTLYGSGRQPLQPPEALSEAARRAFADLVLSCPISQFQAADLPLLCRWAELTVMAEKAAGELAVGGMVTADGRVSPWFAIHERATKGLTALCLRLRLGPQSRAKKAPKTKAGPVSYYDRMRVLEGEHGDVS
jgi:phage terminase small subunit